MDSFDEFSYVGATLARWRRLIHTQQSNTSLRNLVLRVHDMDPEVLKFRGELWGQFLEKSQTLQHLHIEFSRVSWASSTSTSAYLSDLVSGLSCNPHLAIKELTIENMRNSSDMIYISEIIRHTTKLQELTFRRCWGVWLYKDAAAALASSIAGAVQLNLNRLLLSYCVSDDADESDDGLFELLRKIFPADTGSSRRYLPLLEIKRNSLTFLGEYWGVFPLLAGRNISVIASDLSCGNSFPSIYISWWKMFADALQSSPTMSTEIEVLCRVVRGEIRTGNIKVKATHQAEATGELRIGKHNMWSKLVEDALVEFFRQLFDHSIYPNSTIKKLAFSKIEDVSERWWESVFDSLKSSRSITSLDLSGSNLTDGDFQHLMSLLRINVTIEEVNLEQPSWRNDGKAALIDEALGRNKKLGREFSIMKEAGFEFDKARIGRIILCGSPYAGKTQLKLRMMRLRHRRSGSASKPGKISDMLLEGLKMLELRRTRGAEVEVLIDNGEDQVSVWDLAGQYIFRALYDLILPRTNQSLIFVFTFNPFQEDSQKNKKENVYDVFTLELENWLKFIVSNCQISGDDEDVPQLLVVITHRDWTGKSASKSFECGPGSKTRDIIERLQIDFRGVVKLIPHVYHVDARAKKEVRRVLTGILTLMNNWLKRHPVPVVCSAVSSALIALLGSSISTPPVWSLPTFYEFCQSNHERLKNASPEILSTVASYLHDVGRIIIVPGRTESKNVQPLIIVDPNWCTEKFLGAMIAEGNHFDADGGSCSTSGMFTTSADGFIDERQFQSLLQKTLDQMKGQQTERTLLEELLHRFDLCYRYEDDASVRYFIPIISGGLEEKCDLRGRKLQWNDGQMEGCEYLGYRLHCEDTKRTCFNKAFFSRFQIHYRPKLLQRFGMKKSNGAINCGLGLLKVVYDGYEVLVESDEINGQHIDIMIKFSQPGVKRSRTRMQIIKFAQEHFLRELQAFCASSSGCPGIRLRVDVLRTSSVQKLIPIHERQGSQHCVELEVLKGQFRSCIELIMQDMAGDVEEDLLLNFQYTWPERDPDSSRERELAKYFLGCEDLVDVLSQAREKVMNSEREVQTCSDELRQMLTKLSGEPISSAGKSHFVESLLTLEEEGRISRGEASHSRATANDTLQLSQELKPLADFLGSKVDKVGMKLDVVERKIDHLADLTFSVQTELQQLKKHFHKFRSGLFEMQKVMTDVSSSVDKLIGIFSSREDHSCPRRPYFSHDGSDFLPKVKAYVLGAQAVRLHFLCEARNQPHVVQDQAGLPLVITEKDMSWVPFISKMSVKLISTLISVGVQLLAGVKVNPESFLFANLDTGERLPMSDKLLEYMKQNSTKFSIDPADPRVVQSWSLFQKYLGNKLNYQKYRNTFGLCRVRYRYSSDPYAWICESCEQKGTRQRILDPCPPM